MPSFRPNRPRQLALGVAGLGLAVLLARARRISRASPVDGDGSSTTTTSSGSPEPSEQPPVGPAAPPIVDEPSPAVASNRATRVAGTGTGSRPVCIVYGNCQSMALARLLGEDGALGQTHDVVLLAPAHEAGADDVPQMYEEMKRADVVVTQRVRDDYRELGIGTDQLLAHAPASATTITYPALYYDAYLPFQLMLRGPDGESSPAPLTIYHDLRHIAAAANGVAPEDVGQWLADLALDPQACRGLAAAADERYAEYEASLDVRLTDGVTGPRFRPEDFHTVNHPSLATLVRVRDGVLSALGVSAGPVGTGDELLGDIRTPVPPALLKALDVTTDLGTLDWLVHGTRYSSPTVAQMHLERFAAEPSLLMEAIDTHRARLDLLGFLT